MGDTRLVPPAPCGPRDDSSALVSQGGASAPHLAHQPWAWCCPMLPALVSEVARCPEVYALVMKAAEEGVQAHVSHVGDTSTDRMRKHY